MALAHALKMLEKSARSIAEIERALRDRGHEDGEVQEVIEKLRSYGYLDDQGVAAMEKERTIDRQKYGKGRLIQRLEQRGIEGDAISDQLETLTDEAELSRAMAAIEQRDPARSQAVGKIARWLAGRGFDEEIIEGALDQAYPEWRD
ncbi:MAG: recombination regulator RecX [Armatimonadetes bacterium]|nr:recombination regulator RecX [Armatimonadota bacterium]